MGKRHDQTYFIRNDSFRRFLNKCPEIRPLQVVFTLRQIVLTVVAYILANSERFIDPSNIRLAKVEGDSLGQALGVKTIHKTELVDLVRQQLKPLRTAKRAKLKRMRLKRTRLKRARPKRYRDNSDTEVFSEDGYETVTIADLESSRDTSASLRLLREVESDESDY